MKYRQNYTNLKTTHCTNGFTLIEVLIALMILAIALTTIIRISSDNINNTIKIKNHIIARWVAENAIRNAQLGLIPLPKSNSTEQSSTTMLKKKWYLTIAQANTSNEKISNLDVAVSDKEDATPIITLSSFIYTADQDSNSQT